MAKQFPIFPERVFLFENPLARGEYLVANNPETMLEFAAAMPAAEYVLEAVGVLVDPARAEEGEAVGEDFEPFDDDTHGNS